MSNSLLTINEITREAIRTFAESNLFIQGMDQHYRDMFDQYPLDELRALEEPHGVSAAAAVVVGAAAAVAANVPTTRRGLLGGLLALVSAPAIARAESLMPVKPVERIVRPRIARYTGPRLSSIDVLYGKLPVRPEWASLNAGVQEGAQVSALSPSILVRGPTRRQVA